MRINVYSEEMGMPVEVVRKDKVNGDTTFYGLRVWLKSPEEILQHSTPEDDDRNAVTFWSSELTDLEELAEEALEVVRQYIIKQIK